MKNSIRFALVFSLSALLLPACGPDNASGDDDDTTGDGGGRDGASSDAPANDAGDFGDGAAIPDAAPLSDAVILDDRGLPPSDDASCTTTTPGTPPYGKQCAPSTNNECDAATESYLAGKNVVMALRNGSQGNGYDDDCDGLVDEGCFCPGNGVTKDCFMVPATMANPATSQPVGWCTTNSKGSLDCVGTEFAKWSGQCRGAQPPYGDDGCSLGDFNCDGLEQNSSTLNCSCQVDQVTCPTATITRAPYPAPTTIGQIDGSQWINVAAMRPMATNWKWTIVGGDCDNVLPHPTYALYNQANSTASGARRGATTKVRFDMGMNKYVPDAAAPINSLHDGAYGNGVAGGQIYPAFGLSGDYVVQGEFTLGGKNYVCSQRVEVRAPGIRAELCWDTVGPAVGGTDIDLHFARLQGVGNCSGGQTGHGWDLACSNNNMPPYDGCWYDNRSGCRDFSATGPGWGYANSARTACLGWSSKRRPTGTLVSIIPFIVTSQECTNPRLDTDNINCDRSQTDPTNAMFCGPENINLDNPTNGDRFVVGVNYYSPTTAPPPTKPHVNVYCNGARVLSAGYNPATGAQYPVMRVGGADTAGDFWNVATIRTNVSGGAITSCDVNLIPSHHADPTRDGPVMNPGDGNNLCIDSRSNMSTPVFSYSNHHWIESGSAQTGLTAGTIPAAAADFCKH